MLDTLSNVKTALGIDPSDTDNDAFLTQQIKLISEVIERYCRRSLVARNFVQTFYGEDFRDHTGKVTLYHYPVISVSALSIASEPFDVTGLRVHKPTGIIQRGDYGSLYGEEVVFTYRAGYEAANMPLAILDVLYSLVGERYNKKTSGVGLNFGSDVQRISIPGVIGLDFDYTLANNDRESSYGTVLGNYVNVLDDYRSERTIIGSTKLEYVEGVI